MTFNRKTLRINEHRVTYVDQGEGPVIVCLHAIGHSADDYKPFINALSGGFRCIAVDFPGHGESDQGAHAASAEYYAEVIKQLINELCLPPFILIGNSIGGATAILLAERLQHNVKALVLCNPGGLFERSAMTRWATNVMISVFKQGEKQAGWYKYFYSMYYHLVLRNKPAKARRDEIVAQAFAMAKVNREAWESFAAPESDLRERVQTLPHPIFIAWANLDKVNSLQLNLPTIKKLKQAYFKQYRAGHVAFLECPELFMKDFLRFVGDVDEGQAGTNSAKIKTSRKNVT